MRKAIFWGFLGTLAEPGAPSPNPLDPGQYRVYPDAAATLALCAYKGYQNYMLAEGFTSKLVLGEDGQIWAETRDPFTGETSLTRELDAYARLDDPQGARRAAMSADGSVLLADDQQAWLFLPD